MQIGFVLRDKFTIFVDPSRLRAVRMSPLLFLALPPLLLLLVSRVEGGMFAGPMSQGMLVFKAFLVGSAVAIPLVAAWFLYGKVPRDAANGWIRVTSEGFHYHVGDNDLVIPLSDIGAVHVLLRDIGNVPHALWLARDASLPFNKITQTRLRRELGHTIACPSKLGDGAVFPMQLFSNNDIKQVTTRIRDAIKHDDDTFKDRE